MHYYIISGELSGDLYGARLIESLKKLNSKSQFTCWGGHHMKNAGGDVVVSLESLSFIGFWEVFKNFRTVLNNLFFAKKHIKQIKPDALILIDYPGFNIKIAEYAKKQDIPVFWFIAPQVWAWNTGRVKKLKKYLNTLFVALPFELNYFKKRGVNAFYFGHPMVEILTKGSAKIYNNKIKKMTIALMPGSRKQEVKNILPTMLKMIQYFPRYKFSVICVENIEKSFYHKIISNANVELEYNKSYLHTCSAALVASGTATLELAILNIPQVVCYKLHPISYFLARCFSMIQHISLVNILANRVVVKELIQYEFNIKNIKRELELILKHDEQQRIKKEYIKIVNKLSYPDCFNKVSKVIYSELLGIKKYANK